MISLPETEEIESWSELLKTQDWDREEPVFDQLRSGLQFSLDVTWIKASLLHLSTVDHSVYSGCAYFYSHHV